MCWRRCSLFLILSCYNNEVVVTFFVCILYSCYLLRISLVCIHCALRFTLHVRLSRLTSAFHNVARRKRPVCTPRLYTQPRTASFAVGSNVNRKWDRVPKYKYDRPGRCFRLPSPLNPPSVLIYHSPVWSRECTSKRRSGLPVASRVECIVWLKCIKMSRGTEARRLELSIAF